MKDKYFFIILISLLGLLLPDLNYSQRIGVLNDEILVKYRTDYLEQSKIYIQDIAKKKNLSAVINNTGLVWITSEKNKLDITEDLLKILKSKENSLPKIKTKFNADVVSGVKNILKSIRKIKSATEVGISFRLYSAKIVEINGEVSEYLLDIPDGELKEELLKSIEAYTDALTAWNDCISVTYLSSIKDEPFIKKYNIEFILYTEGHKIDEYDRTLILNKIWLAGKTHLENAEQYYKNLN